MSVSTNKMAGRVNAIRRSRSKLPAMRLLKATLVVGTAMLIFAAGTVVAALNAESIYMALVGDAKDTYTALNQRDHPEVAQALGEAFLYTQRSLCIARLRWTDTLEPFSYAKPKFGPLERCLMLGGRRVGEASADSRTERSLALSSSLDATGNLRRPPDDGCNLFAEEYRYACQARVLERCFDTKVNDYACAAAVIRKLVKANR
jgi:hypothetical protein